MDHVKSAAAQRKRDVRGRNIANGLCPCGGPRDVIREWTGELLKTCSKCREYERPLKDRPHIRVVKLHNDAPPMPVKVSMTRIDVLRQVNRAWLDAPNVGKFSAWLRSQIEACENAEAKKKPA